MHATFQATRNDCPSQHQAAYDAAVNAIPVADQPKAGGFLQGLIALIKAAGLSINWPCLIAQIPALVAAFSNPAALLAIFTAYMACAHPTPPTP